MAITRPTLEQVTFRSAKTGTHLLDTYLEASEKGNRTLVDLLDDIFDVSGNMRTDLFEFRVDETTYRLQTRRGIYTNANTGWVDVPDGGFFAPRGDWTPGSTYYIHDIVRHQNSLYMVTEEHSYSSLATVPDTSKMLVLLNGSTFYSVGPNQPTSANAGTKWFNTTNNTLFIYDGTTWNSYTTSVHTEFIGLSVNSTGNLIVTRAQGNIVASDYKQWFFALSDSDFEIDANGHLIVSY